MCSGAIDPFTAYRVSAFRRDDWDQESARTRLGRQTRLFVQIVSRKKPDDDGTPRSTKAHEPHKLDPAVRANLVSPSSTRFRLGSALGERSGTCALLRLPSPISTDVTSSAQRGADAIDEAGSSKAPFPEAPETAGEEILAGDESAGLHETDTSDRDETPADTLPESSASEAFDESGARVSPTSPEADSSGLEFPFTEIHRRTTLGRPFFGSLSQLSELPDHMIEHLDAESAANLKAAMENPEQNAPPVFDAETIRDMQAWFSPRSSARWDGSRLNPNFNLVDDYRLLHARIAAGEHDREPVDTLLDRQIPQIKPPRRKHGIRPAHGGTFRRFSKLDPALFRSNAVCFPISL